MQTRGIMPFWNWSHSVFSGQEMSREALVSSRHFVRRGSRSQPVSKRRSQPSAISVWLRGSHSRLELHSVDGPPYYYCTWATTRSAAPPPPPPRFIKTSEHSTYLRFLVIKRNSKGGLSLAMAGVLTSRIALAPHDGIWFRLESTSTVLCLAHFLS